MLLHCDGFDKYGGVNSKDTVVSGLLTAGEWTSVVGASFNIVAGLSATGYALNLTGNAGVIKTLGNNTRLIGGVRFASTLAGISGIQFYDTGTAQAGIGINTTGTVSVRNGSYASGTVLGTSTVSVTASSVHYLEWDITFANSGSYQIWLDGVSILSGSGDTTATASAFANQVGLGGAASSNVTYDDFYIFDASGTTNNAVLLTSPRIETQIPTSDGAVQFAVGAAILGTNVSRVNGTSNTAANQIRVRPFTPSRTMALNSIGFLPGATNASINFRPVVYSDNSGLPGTLLSAGSTVTGATVGVAVTMPLTTPQALTAGTQYWLGHMVDVLLNSGLTSLDATLTDRVATATFSSGAPGTAPATGTTLATLIWGNVSGAGANYYSLPNPPAGNNSYVYDATVAHEDLYNFPALTAAAPTNYAVAVKASVSKSDAGAKTLSLRTKSGATDSAGSASSIAPGTSFAWATTLFPTDPATGGAWTKAGLDAAQSGVKVET